MTFNGKSLAFDFSLLISNRHLSSGPVFGVVMCFVVVFMHLNWCFWDWLYPSKYIEKCPDIGILSVDHSIAVSSAGEIGRHSAKRNKMFNYSS